MALPSHQWLPSKKTGLPRAFLILEWRGKSAAELIVAKSSVRTGSSLVSLSINQANLKSQNAEQATIARFFNFEIIVKLGLNKRGVKATMVILEARLTEMVV